MSTIVEKTADGTIYRAAKTYPVPDVDILTLLFDSEQSRANPQTPIHISAADPSLILTISRARTLTHATSAALRKHFSIGANGPGQDICSVISTGHYLLPVLSYGIIGAGGVFSAASAASTAGELSKQIQGARSKVLVTVEATQEVAVKAAEEAEWGTNGGGRVLLMSEGAEGAEWALQPIKENGQLGENLIDERDTLPWQKITDPRELEKSLVILIYSSGTTGLPKGVKLSHRNLVAETVIPGDIFKSWIASMRPSFEYRTIAHLPTAHIAGIQGYLLNPFYMHGAVYWMPRFDFAAFLAYNAAFKITFFFTVPPIYLLIAKSPAATTQFRTLEVAISGAAPLGADLQAAASAKLGGPDCFISQTWGLSETTGSATLMPIESRDTSGSVSPLLPNMTARLVDDAGADVTPGSPGEILVRGPVVCTGYFENPAADAESFAAGWFCTGDIGVFRDGLLYIVDRKKELIKYKGLQVAPAELEAVLLAHPRVRDAAVIGVRTEDGGEVPRAFVVADEGVVAEEVVAWVANRVAPYKRLRGGVVFVDVVPKSPAGKILRKELRARVEKEERAKL